MQVVDSQEEMLARDDLGSNPQGGGKQSLLASNRLKFSSQQSRNSNIPSEDDDSED